MDAPSLFSDKELAFLVALVEGEVSFLVVGLAAAALQGAPAVTQDVDSWFRDWTRGWPERSSESAPLIPPTHLTPPEPGTDLFAYMHGLETFEEEARRATVVKVGALLYPCCRSSAQPSDRSGYARETSSSLPKAQQPLSRIRCSSVPLSPPSRTGPELRMAKYTCFSFQLAEHQLGDEGRANDVWVAGR